MISMTLRLLAAREVPVSVISTIASTSSGTFTSVEPQLNSTLALTPLDSRNRVVRPTASVAIRFPSRSVTDQIGELFGTTRTQRVGLEVDLLYSSFSINSTSELFSSIQSLPVI